MKTLIISLLVTLLLLTASPLAQGQDARLYDKDQIGSQTVQALCQDERNFLWMGTDNGLCRFDGTQFTTYVHSENDSTSLSDNTVRTLLIDREQRLWVGTENGLQRYLPEKDCFQRVRLDQLDFGGYIYSIIQRRNGEILFDVSGAGIFRLDPDRMTGSPVNRPSPLYHFRYINHLYEDRHGQLWLGTDRQGVVRIRPETGEEKLFPLPPTAVKKILETSDNQLFVITNYNVYLLDEEKDRLQMLPYRGKHRGFSIRSAITNSQGDIIIGTGHGLIQVKRGSMEVTDLQTIYNPFIDINSTRVLTLLEDRQRNLWIACQYQGILMLPATPMPFHYWSLPKTQMDVPGNPLALCATRDGSLWCTVEDNGLYRLNRRGKVLQHIDFPQSIASLYEDSEGTLWAGVNGKGLYTVDAPNGRFHPRYAIQGDYVIKAITEDSLQNLHVSILGAGILRYHLPTGQTLFSSHETPLGNREELVNYWITTILCDSQGRVWTGHYGGVSCYDTRTHRFVRLPFRPWVRSNTYYAIVEGADGRIWMGCRNGLLCYDPKTQAYETYTTEQGLPSNRVYSIALDQEGNLWCSAERGIFHLDVRNRRVTSYYTGNGLEDKAYIMGGCTQDKDGNIYFCGENGITHFNPRDIRPIVMDKAPCLTDLFIRDRKVTRQTLSDGRPVIDRPLIDAEKIRLSHADNNFTLLVSTMDYRDARSVFYEYRLNELEDSWNPTRPGEGRIQYPLLPPGNYTLEIRACENGVYSPVRTVRIEVTPPWHQRPLARLAYLLLAVGVGYLVFTALKRKRMQKNSEMKLQFFINIAHEIRSPLTLVINPLNKMLKKTYDPETSRMLANMQRNTHRILSLLNQLLDIRKIDKGQMRLRFAETDIRQFVENTASLFNEPARQKEIRLSLHIPEGLPPVWVDPNNFDKVLTNLLSNALKYTPQGGSVSISLSMGTQEKESGPLHEYLEIAIADTGKGLNEKELTRIFERFYQGNANETTTPLGFGIGLNLCQLLVKLHHGIIFAENRKDTQGSRFIIRIPLGLKLLKPEDIIAPQPLPERKEEPQPSFTESPEKPERHKTNYHILVIDDDEELRNFLAENLSPIYHVDTATDGTEGWKKALKLLPDAIISDIVMPGMDGIQLVKELKRNGNTNHIPVILLTSKTEFASRIEGLEQGADGYVCKPFNMDELEALTANLIANRLRVKGKYSGNQELNGKIQAEEIQSNDDTLMERITQAVSTHLNNPEFNVEMLSQEVGMSRTQLHRRMKELTGISPSDFIRNIRLRQAATLLKSKTLTITQIAYTVGFTSQTHFSSSFKKMYGMSPKEYMESQETS